MEKKTKNQTNEYHYVAVCFLDVVFLFVNNISTLLNFVGTWLQPLVQHCLYWRGRRNCVHI